MKKLITIVFVFAIIFASIFVVKSTQSTMANAKPTTSGYAKVVTNDCYFLNLPDKNSKVFLLEQSYFVFVTENFDDTFFKVKYLEFEGYVEKNKVCFVEEYPESPYLVGRARAGRE